MINRVTPIPTQLRAQVVSLRRAGMMVPDICERLGIFKPGERAAVASICDSLPNRHQVGLVPQFPRRKSRRVG